MFKKKVDVALAPSHLVSGADRKRLLRRVVEAFKLDAEEAAELLPPKGQLALARFSPPSRAAVYTLDGEPWLLDARAGRPDDLMPTVLALWRLPALLPAVPLRHAAVSHYILNGADLMLPGIQPDALPPLPAGAVCSMCAPGNPAPLAVGRTLMSSQQMRERGGGKGRCVELLHAFGDMLWALSPSRATPNDGFTPDGVLPIEAGSGNGEAQPDALGGANGAAEQLDGLNLRNGSESASAAQKTQSAAAGDGIAAAAAAAAPAVATEPPAAEPPAEGRQEAASPAASPGEMDALLQEALLQALHSVKDGQLPLAGGQLWNTFLLPGRRAGTHLDLKASFHKKLSKLLQAHGQAGSKLLTLREDKASGETHVTGIDRRHQLYRVHRKWPESDTAGAAAASEAAANDASGLRIEELFRPHINTVPIFEAVGADPKALYTPQQASEVAVAYAQRAQLDRGARAPTHILLDTALCDALFKGVLKKGEQSPMELPKAQLRGAFLARLLPQLRLTRGGLSAARKGALPPVQVTTEKRRDKKVTRVVGVETFLLDASEVAADLQRRFAAAATVAELPGERSKGHYEIVLQGEVVEKLGAYLKSAYGIPDKYVQVKGPVKKGGKK